VKTPRATGQTPRQRRTAHLDWWRRSPEFRAIAKAQCRKMNAAHRRKPRCGATRRTDGGVCEQPAMENGRCYWHGGRTPKGENWHKAIFPADGAGWAAKSRDLARAAKKRAKHLVAMSPDEVAAHRAWQRTHKPGPPGPRARASAERQGARAMQRALNGADDPGPVSPERAELQARAAELRRILAEAEARLAGGSEPPGNAFD
jgi:hypothetical protein